MAVLIIPKSVADSFINMINSFLSFTKASRYGLDREKTFAKGGDLALQEWFNKNIKSYIGPDPTTIIVVDFEKFTGNDVNSGKKYVGIWKKQYTQVRIYLMSYGTPELVASLDKWFNKYAVPSRGK